MTKAKKDWEERFNKEFVENLEWVFHDPECCHCEKIEVDDTGGKRVIGYTKNDKCCVSEPRRTAVMGFCKGFIQSLLKQQREEILERIIAELQKPFVQEKGIDEKESIIKWLHSLKKRNKTK